MKKKSTKSVHRLKAGNVARTFSLNSENYIELKKKVVDLCTETGSNISVSEVIDLLIEGYLNGKFKLFKS